MGDDAWPLEGILWRRIWEGFASVLEECYGSLYIGQPWSVPEELQWLVATIDCLRRNQNLSVEVLFCRKVDWLIDWRGCLCRRMFS